MNRTSFLIIALMAVLLPNTHALFTGGIRIPTAEVASIASKLPKQATAYGFPSKPGLIFKKSPKHRAWGGETEPPVQAKAIPNVDMTKVDPWITFEEFLESSALKKVKGVDEEALQAVYCALAGGARYLTRSAAEESLAKWTDSSGKKFSQSGFQSALQAGRVDLAIGWASFLFLTVGFASCIVAPTSPAPQALERLVDVGLDNLAAAIDKQDLRDIQKTL